MKSFNLHQEQLLEQPLRTVRGREELFKCNEM